ncbi:xylose isomerase-like protein [Dendrothele bispora CBS 962.96]|uniref:Xylose isomerase-like protein n=1 Tax=Dendrothele bispora (strain CBS 962.96) TaxID=1314807 RepID=A0A4S8M9R1_DENBC|nr:xylose isomerase-like protein [Dendrothele bispora CBS 962.96]
MDPNLLLAKNQLQRPHSFVSDSDLSSSFDTTTLSSGTTVGGLGTISGRLIESLGSLVIRTTDDFAIWARLISIRRTPGLQGPDRLWDDLLEFSRCLKETSRHSLYKSRLVFQTIGQKSDKKFKQLRLDYSPGFRRETVHEDVRNRFRYSTSINELRTGTAHFALLLDTLISEASSAVAFGGQMWVKLGNFLNMQCSRTYAQLTWSKMTTAILQPRSRQFVEYKETVSSRYREVDPTLFFIEFCAAQCPILIKDFCDLGLDSFFLLLLNNLLPGPLFCELNPQEQKETLANTTGYGTVDEERCICNVIFIALLAMSLIHDSQEDEHTKLRYQACVRSILISVRNHDLDFWDACVSYRTVLGAGTEVDPNILLALFRLQEKMYNVSYEEEVSFEHGLRQLLLLLNGQGDSDMGYLLLNGQGDSDMGYLLLNGQGDSDMGYLYDWNRPLMPSKFYRSVQTVDGEVNIHQTEVSKDLASTFSSRPKCRALKNNTRGRIPLHELGTIVDFRNYPVRLQDMALYLRPQFAIASLSLGTSAHHDLPNKIRVASSLGYDGIEIFIPDFEAFVEEVRHGLHSELFEPKSSSHLDILAQPELELECARAISTYCSSHNLEIPLFQPYRNFENFRSQEDLDAALKGAERWFPIMSALNCDLMLVNAFRQLGTLAAKYNLRIGYEPLSWGTVIDNWMQVWDIVRRVDMDNVGIIFDSFNSLGNQYADPGQSSCIRPGQTLSAMLENLEEMSRTIPADRIFFYQVADAVRPPQICEDSDDMPRRMKWSRACRVFPCEPLPQSSSTSSLSHDPSFDPSNPPSGYLGFLPVVEMTSFLHHGNGYRGWWSLEVFNTSLQEPDKGCPWRHGRRGIDGLRSLWEVVKSTAPSVRESVTVEPEINEGVSEALKEGLGLQYHRSLASSSTDSMHSTPPLSDSEGFSSPSSTSEIDENEFSVQESQTQNIPGMLSYSEKMGIEEVRVEKYQPDIDVRS